MENNAINLGLLQHGGRICGIEQGDFFFHHTEYARCICSLKFRNKDWRPCISEYLNSF